MYNFLMNLRKKSLKNFTVFSYLWNENHKKDFPWFCSTRFSVGENFIWKATSIFHSLSLHTEKYIIKRNIAFIVIRRAELYVIKMYWKTPEIIYFWITSPQFSVGKNVITWFRSTKKRISTYIKDCT